MNMKYIEYVYERHQKITNIVGTVLVAWILSALLCNVIGLFLPSPVPFATARSTDTTSASSGFNDEVRDIAFYMPICERNLFDSLKQSPCENSPVATSEGEGELSPIDPNADPVKSSISAKLLGTVVSNLEKLSRATISESGKKELKNYHIGDLINGEASIYAIERNRVYFTNSGRKEYLEVDRMTNPYRTQTSAISSNPSTSAGVRPEGGKVVISSQKVDSIMGNLNEVLQQARMVPNFDATTNQTDGFKIFGIRTGSIFQDLGLQNGDVINRVNGTQMDGIEKALPMLQLLKSEKSYTIDITRRGQKQTMDISVQ